MSDKTTRENIVEAADELFYRLGFEHTSFSGDDGVFLLVGSLQPGLGGAIVAHATSLPELEARVNADPFVMENVVTTRILQVAPAKADQRLRFLLG
ncbi:MAG TPA: hypothetical protein VM406_14095 [Noviherbaspirillum sp.]|nr:hypothetical protein [Noviherbaspirillum sp.]